MMDREHHQDKEHKAAAHLTRESCQFRMTQPKKEKTESDRLAEVCRQYLVFLDPGNSAQSDAGRVAARIINLNLPKYAPKLARQFERARNAEIDAIYVTGLPVDAEIASLVILSLTYALGLPFNYTTQNDGALIMVVRSDRNSKVANTNATADEFRWHTDDAAVRRSCRVSWILLYGVANPPNTFTGYVPIAPVVARLYERTKATLFERRFLVRVPPSFELGADIWSEPVAILSRSQTGAVEIAWPSYATRPIITTDQDAIEALVELEATVNEFTVHVPVDPGCLLCFSNFRGVHMRSKIGEGERLIFRTYASESLDELRRRTGSFGPVFDTRAVLAADPT